MSQQGYVYELPAIYNGYETWKLDTQHCATFNFTKKRDQGGYSS